MAIYSTIDCTYEFANVLDGLLIDISYLNLLITFAPRVKIMAR